jgi:hypothetical protein
LVIRVFSKIPSSYDVGDGDRRPGISWSGKLDNVPRVAADTDMARVLGSVLVPSDGLGKAGANSLNDLGTSWGTNVVLTVVSGGIDSRGGYLS